MAIITNACEIQGRLNRMDVKKGVAKTGNEYISVTFTLQVGDSQLRVENFSMKNKKDGTELASYQGLMTIFNEANALHKTMKEIGDEKAEEVQDETIVENIDECTAIRFSNYGNFKYCRIEENSYVKDGELVKNLRLVGASPNRIDESKKEYEPKADFEVAGVVTTCPIVMEKDEVEFMQFKVMIPIYQEAWGDREAKVDLVEMTVRLNDESAFGYVEDEFAVGSFVSLNGTIVREVRRVELEEQRRREEEDRQRRLEEQRRREEEERQRKLEEQKRLEIINKCKKYGIVIK